MSRFVVFAVFLLEALLLQWRGGAYRSELGANPDEAAHFVTALMVRDYLAAGAPWPPMRYAENYYEHYPKVAMGHWPPGYYAASGAWMLLFPPSKGSILALQAVIAALTATLLFGFALRVAAGPQAFAIAASFLFLNPIAESTRNVMSDLFVALLVLAGITFLVRFTETLERRWGLAFGLATAAALLTKGSALLLIPAAPLAFLFSGRIKYLAKPHLWVCLGSAAAAAAPWYLLAPGAWHQRAVPQGPVDLVHSAHTYVRFLGRCLADWVEAIGPWILPFLILGLTVRLVVPLGRQRRVDPVWGALGACLALMPILYEFVRPFRDARHSILILPPLLLFSLEGIRWVLGRRHFSRLSAKANTWIAALILPALLLCGQRPLQQKQHVGFGPVAEYLLSAQNPAGAFLISSDAEGEGMLVSEVAVRDQRPGRRVLRATKVLSSYNWLGENERLLYSSPLDVRDLLRRGGVQAVIFDEEPSWVPVHHRLLKQTLHGYPAEWRLAASFPRRKGLHYSRDSLRVYVHEDLDSGHRDPLLVRQLPLPKR